MDRRPLLALLAVFCLVNITRAGARVELELVTTGRFSGLETRNWYQLLTSQLKVDSLRIRASRPGDKIEIETRGTKSSPVYRVTGALTAGNQLVLPNGKYTLRDGSRLATWLAGLREHGPGGSSGKGGDTFGLDDAALEKTLADLAPRVDFSTYGADRASTLGRLTRALKSRVTATREANDALAEAGPIEEELRGLSAGTAIACLLRPAGLALVPRADARSGVSFEIASAKRVKQAWPVGFSAEDTRQKTLPALFEVIEVEIDKGTSLTAAIEAVVKRLEVPLLIDHNAAAAEGVDMKTATTFLPAAKLSYSLILRKLLGQNKLKYELRKDESGRPFIWITSYRQH